MRKRFKVLSFFALVAFSVFTLEGAHEEIPNMENIEVRLIGHKIVGSGEKKILVMHNIIRGDNAVCNIKRW